MIMRIIATICLAPIFIRLLDISHVSSHYHSKHIRLLLYTLGFGNVPGQLALTEDILENILKVVLVTIFKGEKPLVVNTASTIYQHERSRAGQL